MFAKKILFPTDFSEASQAAFDHAVMLARDTGATLLIAHVDEPTLPYTEAYVALPDTTEETRQRLQAIVPLDATIHCEHRLLRGDAAQEIVRLANEEQVDLIVMGTHGRTGLRRLLMGSVAEAVVRHAACPVYTIKQPELAAH